MTFIQKYPHRWKGYGLISFIFFTVYVFIWKQAIRDLDPVSHECLFPTAIHIRTFNRTELQHRHSFYTKIVSYDTGIIRDVCYYDACKIQYPFFYNATSDIQHYLATNHSAILCPFTETSKVIYSWLLEMYPFSKIGSVIHENSPKYFKESKGTQYHTDVRFTRFDDYFTLFERKTKDSPAVRAYPLVKSLFQAWNNFTTEHRFTWWIAHGALIGWYWNQQLLPWDVDIDVQTTLTDFQSILLPLNQTVWQDRYLLDINPQSFARQHQSNNVIDARFIDMENGLYVDITVLSLLQVAHVNSTLSDAFCSNATIEPLLVCKSPHIYTPSDIFPLRQTLFENIQVYRPNDAYSVLKQEYGIKSMTEERYKNFAFNSKLKEWSILE